MEISEAVESALRRLSEERQETLRISHAMLQADDGIMYPVDMLALAAAKRNLSTSAAIESMVRQLNMLSARALLRVHIDTLLRFTATWHVLDPQSFARDILGGARIDRLKSRNGLQLTDANLIKLNELDAPWLRAVYDNLSGYVHFSSEHIYSTLQKAREDNQSVSIEVRADDTKFPESSWLEVTDCVSETNRLLQEYLAGYAATKSMSPEELERGRQKRDG